MNSRTRLLLTVGVGLALLAALTASVWRAAFAPAPLPDFAAFDDVTERKQAFFDFLAPRVLAANRRVLDARERLMDIDRALADGREPDWLDHRWLKRLAAEYDVDWGDEPVGAIVDTLKRRVDIVPPALALIQAATESGWGQSRFAVEANNLFGHWCYRPGCGLIPEARRAGARHEVAAFDSARQSVQRYLHNLNTHDAYRPFRRLRGAERQASRQPRADVLVDGLLRYSERREAYVEEIRATIRLNRPLIERALDNAGESA